MHQMLMQLPQPVIPRIILVATSALSYYLASHTDRRVTRLGKMAHRVMTSLTLRRVGMNTILLFRFIFQILQ